MPYEPLADLATVPSSLLISMRSQRPGQRHAELDDPLGDRHDDVGGFAIGILKRDGERQIEELAALLEVQHRLVTWRPLRCGN